MSAEDILTKLVDNCIVVYFNNLGGETEVKEQIKRLVIETATQIEQQQHYGCPCLHTTPCRDTCTCVNPVMSGGCSRCAAYGSDEQQKSAAEKIASILDNYQQQRERVEKLEVGIKNALARMLGGSMAEIKEILESALAEPEANGD